MKILKNQKGFVMIAAMLFLVVLTIIGIAATNTTTIEVNIAGNEKIYKQNFYLAEGAAKEAANQNLESEWVWDFNKKDFPDDGNGNVDESEDSSLWSQNSVLEGQIIGAKINFGIVDKDIPQGIIGSGHSLKIDGTDNAQGRIHFFDLYGRSQQNNSIVRIKMGYTKRL